MLNLGVVGAGVMGTNHVRVLNQLSSKTVKVYDTDSFRVKKLESSYNVIGYTDVDNMLDSVDAVIISTPTYTHFDIASNAICRGVHVMIEKPLTSLIKDAETLIEERDSSGVVAMVGHIERFNPAIVALKKILNDGVIGTPLTFTIKRVGPNPPRITDVGVLMDIGIHDVDLVQHLFGDISSVLAYASSVSNIQEEYATMILKVGNVKEVFGVSEVNWLTPHKVRQLSVVGTAGVVDVDLITCGVRVSNKEWVMDYKVDKCEPLVQELKTFLSLCNGEEVEYPTLESGMSAVKVISSAIQSFKEQRICYLS